MFMVFMFINKHIYIYVSFLVGCVNTTVVMWVRDDIVVIPIEGLFNFHTNYNHKSTVNPFSYVIKTFLSSCKTIFCYEIFAKNNLVN